MEKFLFITDFDGTITAQDFFWQIIYRYKPEKAFFRTKKRGLAMLSEIFSNLNLTEAEILDEIKHVAFDPSFVDFVRFINEHGGKVLILSAGARYYIENKLKFENLSENDVDIIANNSFYDKTSGSIKFVENKHNEFYDEVFGINKLKIVQYYREKFDVLAYAGDSYVDFDACRLCDFKFAKKNLHKILNMFYIKNSEFVNFSQIKSILEDKFTKK